MGHGSRRRLDGAGRVIAIGSALAILLPAVSWHTVAATPLLQPYLATPVGSSPDAVAIGDVNGDGRADVVMTTWYANDPADDYRLFVFAQTSAGQLAAPVSYPTAATYAHKPDSVAIGDVTGDGRPDVIVGVAGTGIQIFPQLPGGGLGAPTLVPASDSEMVALGHLGGHGALDIAAIGWGTNTVSVFLNDGTGTFGSPQVYSVLHGGYDDLKVADVSGDGLDDLVVMSGQLYADPNVSVLAQLPGGGFGTPATYSVGADILTSGIGIGDVTGDGRADVVASYGGNRPASNIAVFGQTPAGTLAPPVSYASYDVPEPVAVADLDLDGHADVVTLHGGWQAAGLYPGQAGGTLGTEQLYPIPYASRYGPGSLAVGDINGDGWPDVAVADSNNGLVVLLNYGAASPPPSPSPSPTPTPSPSPTPTPTPSPSPTPTPTPSQAPSAPQALTTSPDLAAGVGLSWAPPANTGSSQLSSYRIYRGTAAGTETFLASVPATTTSYTDTAVTDGTTYFYEVSAVSAAGDSPMSTEAIAQRGTPPSAPQALTATAGKGQVSLAWAAPSSNGGSAVTGYDIYRGTSSGGETFVASVGASTTSYTDAGLLRRTRYFYRVTALNPLGESAPSAEVSAVPK